MKQSSDDTPHEENGNEHGNEREGHGKYGKTYLARSLEGRFHYSFTLLHVSDDILQHDDGVVDHKPNAQCEGHQRQVIEAITAKVHYRKGSHD